MKWTRLGSRNAALSDGYISLVSGHYPIPRLIDELPDLVIQTTRDGLILAHGGGCEVPALVPQTEAIGKTLDCIYPPLVATLIKQLVRKAIASRVNAQSILSHGDQAYGIRVTVQGPNRALCIIRAESGARDPNEQSIFGDDAQSPRLDRRGFIRNFKVTLAKCVMAERPAAVVIIYLDGLNDVSRVFDQQIAEQLVGAAIRRCGIAGDALGELSEGMLGIVIETSNRDVIEASVARICQHLLEPITLGDSVFHLAPYAGVAILGQDCGSADGLLHHARAAATEARRSGASDVYFFSDTTKLRSLARLDIARELHDAIASGGIGTRYVGRYDLSTGRLAALVSYVRWEHPLRGDVPPKEFLSVAEASGATISLSRAILQSLRAGFACIAAQVDETVRVSYGPLRHHLLHHDFVSEIEQLLSDGEIPARRLEIRIAERTFVILRPAVWDRLHQLGVQLVVDEVGRGMASFDRLAQAPLWGLQLDRAWVEALRSDEVARKVCRVGITAATSLGLYPIATGVDEPEQRLALLALGCGYGTGDLYANTSFDSGTVKRIA